MAAHKGFTIEVTSRYEEWWRYNVALMCGCFDAEERRTGFASAASVVAGVGSNLPERPAEIPAFRTARLTTGPCDHLVLYIYIVPHTLPAGNAFDATRPIKNDLKNACDGRLFRSEIRLIFLWSGSSIELRVDSHL